MSPYSSVAFCYLWALFESLHFMICGSWSIWQDHPWLLKASCYFCRPVFYCRTINLSVIRMRFSKYSVQGTMNLFIFKQLVDDLKLARNLGCFLLVGCFTCFQCPWRSIWGCFSMAISLLFSWPLWEWYWELINA